MTEPYRIRVTARAGRTIEQKLPEAAAAAVIEFLTGALAANPQRVGKPLRYELEGAYAARRGAYRVIYEVDDVLRVVTVLRIDHRADVYRPR